MTPFYTTLTAAAELGISPRRVRAMIQAGRLPARQAGRDWLITPAALDTVRDRKPGRPPASAQRRRKEKVL